MAYYMITHVVFFIFIFYVMKSIDEFVSYKSVFVYKVLYNECKYDFWKILDYI